MSFNIYTDYDQQFIYIEKNSHWYMTLYDVPESGEIHIIPVPAIKDTSVLIKEDINEYDCFEYHKITRCSKCDGSGFFKDSWTWEYEICDCYYGQRQGYKDLEDFLEEDNEGWL